MTNETAGTGLVAWSNIRTGNLEPSNDLRMRYSQQYLRSDCQKTAWKSLAAALNVPKSTLCDEKNEWKLVRYWSTVIGTIMDSDKLALLRYVLSFIRALCLNQTHVFNSKKTWVWELQYLSKKNISILQQAKVWHGLSWITTPENREELILFLSERKWCSLVLLLNRGMEIPKKCNPKLKIGTWPFVGAVRTEKKSKILTRRKFGNKVTIGDKWWIQVLP